MKYIFRITIFIVLLEMFSISAWSATWKVQARKVYDGDTILLSSGEKIRLRGIDSPETAHDGKPAQYYAQEAKEELWRLIRGQQLRLETSDIGVDRYGRVLGLVFLPDGRLLNKVMIQKGLAFCFPHTGKGDIKYEPWQEKMLAAQRVAMSSQRGFWARILNMTSARQRMLGNKRSKRFHILSCKYAKRMSARNQKLFSSLREAFYAGYAPCRTCTIWPAASY